MLNSNTPVIPKLIAVGVVMALLAMMSGFILGVVFGVKESSIKSHLDNSGTEVLQSAYGGDVAAKNAVVKKSWVYLKRAHMHGGAIGAVALAAIMALIVLCPFGPIARLSALALGSGAFIYSLFWLFAGLAAPGLGSTGAAKESLWFIAIPGSGLCVMGLLGIIFSIVRSTLFRSSEA